MAHTLQVEMDNTETFFISCRDCDWRRDFSQDIHWAPSVEDILEAAKEHTQI